MPIELYLALEDNMEVRQYQIRTISESIRTSTVHLMNVQLARKDRIKDGQRLWGFSWDKEGGQEPQTKEQMKSMMKMIAGHNFSKKKNKDKK